jgi:integrase
MSSDLHARASDNSSPAALTRAEHVLRALRAFQTTQRQERLRLGQPLQPEHHVVANEIARPLSPEWYSQLWRDNVKAAGLPPIRLHDARHLAATTMHLDGVPVVTAAAWLGHTPRVYEDTYVHGDHGYGAVSASLGRLASGDN